MSTKPFRSPLLKRLAGDENHEHISKKTKIEGVVSGPRLVFKNPGISNLPRKPLLEINKTAAVTNGSTSEGFYSVLWRKLTSKKNKVWEGDALLRVDGDGLAELHDRENGRSLGRSKCSQPLLPGSTLLISGKDVEIDSVLARAQYLDLKESSASRKSKEIPAREQKPITLDKAVSSEAKQTHEKRKIPLKLASIKRKEPQTAAETAAPVEHTKHAIPSPVGAKLLPRHDPQAPGALVMKRSPNALVDVVVDPLLSGQLREHQREGIKFMYECVMGLRDYNGHGAILADEMGLGKTLQTIALLWTLLKQSPSGGRSVIKKAIIVCPATLINNWRKEFKKWLGLDRIGVLVAGTESRVRDFTHGKSYSIMIVGYEKLRNIQSELAKGHGVDLIVADEAHRLKTAKNKSAQAIKALPTQRRIFLTGTPIQNDLTEFFILVDTVAPGTLGTFKAFGKDFESPISRGRQPGASAEETEEGEQCNRELGMLTSPFILRRTASVLAKYLPAKSEHVLFCRPTETQRALYRHLTASPAFRAAASGNSESPLQLITLLKKACNSPSLLRKKASLEDAHLGNSSSDGLLSDIPHQLLSNNASSTKLRMLDELLHNIRLTTTEKVVLVSNYTSTLDLLGQLLTSVGHKFCRIDGSIPARKRQGMIDDFNRSSAEQCFAFLLSAKTGGVGINLVGASRLVLFDVDWNPATDLQAMARIHRDGQKHSCFIYRFLMAGGIDEKIWQRQIVKLGLAGNLMDQKAETSSFSKEDLKDLFRLDENLACQTHELIGCSCRGKGADFVDIDSFDELEVLSNIPTFMKATTVDGDDEGEKEEENEGKTKKAAYAARDALMAYNHVDTSRFQDDSDEEHEALIQDEVLLKTLKDEGNRISFVFSKTSV